MDELLIPRQALDDSATRLMMALLADERPTYTTLTRRTGLSRETVFRRLRKLRDAGLVTWEENSKGTIRPTVRIVGRTS